jgi:hypothetical protein
MSARSRLDPYEQGDFDGLCGIYAIINAARLAIGTTRPDLDEEAWQNLFYALLQAADQSVGVANAAMAGIGTKRIRELLGFASSYLADEHGVRLRHQRAIKRRTRPSLKALMPELADWTAVPGSAVLIGFDGHLNHWTVLRRVTASSLVLFDSSGHSRVSIGCCRMAYERSPTRKREHVIDAGGVFRLIVS